MKAEDIARQWRELGAAAQFRWASLTDVEIARIAGDRSQLEAALQVKYGRSREQAEAEVDHWLTRLGAPAKQAKQQGADR